MLNNKRRPAGDRTALRSLAASKIPTEIRAKLQTRPRLLGTLRPGTRLAVAADLTSPGEWIRMDTVEGWLARPPGPIGKRPAIFLLLA